MKFTLGWLKEHLDTSASLEEIGKALTALGLEVESIEDRAAAFAPFKVAFVEKAEKHPDADRLKVCIVDTGTEKLQVVCGAPNARAGMKGIFAPAGSYIPGTAMTLKKGNIRGQESNGMLVSEREMGLSDEHQGIIEVPDNVAVGTPMADLYGFNDPLIVIGLTPNRADAAGVGGIARDLAAKGLGTLKPLDENKIKGSFKSPVGVSLKFEKGTENACPLFLGRFIKGVKNGPSPQWLQDRLKAIGLRPISALVDVTNYLSYDLCRPLHVFDADKLKGNIHVRLAQKGEMLKALNGKDYELSDFMSVVCDDSGVLGLGGVIGGEATGCTETTTNVYIECAYFDPARTAKTGRALQIDSDARYRFERGIDPAFTIPGIEMATRLIQSLCGGEASEVVVAGSVPDTKRTIIHDPAYVSKLGGSDVPLPEQKQILQSLGFVVDDKNKGAWGVIPPSWRGDIEGRADLVEEILRVRGYDAIPPVSVTKQGAVAQNAETANVTRARRARTALASRGMNECVTWSFMPSGKAETFGANDHQTAASLTLTNPISADLDRMRPTPLPNLIEAAARNRAKGYADTALFEVGPAFANPKAAGGQKLVACGVRAGLKQGRHWSGAESGRNVDAFDAKADALSVIAACGAPTESIQVSRDAPAWYHPGRSGSLRMGANVLAVFGELHPSALETMDAKAPMAGFEVFLDNLPQARKKSGTAKALLKLAALQPVSRDFAFLVDRKIEADVLVKAVRGVDKELIVAVDVFDVFEGKGVPEGKKSVALTVTFQPKEQTLTEVDLEALAKKIVDAVAAKTGGVLRS